VNVIILVIVMNLLESFRVNMYAQMQQKGKR